METAAIKTKGTDKVKWSVNINNIFMDSLISNLSRSHVYTNCEALAYLLQKAFLAAVLRNEQWISITKSDLSQQFHWYHAKTDQFFKLGIKAGLFETQTSGRNTLIRFKGLKSEQELPVEQNSAPSEAKIEQPRTEEHLETEKQPRAKSEIPGGKLWYDN